MYFFSPPGENERLIKQAGFKLLKPGIPLEAPRCFRSAGMMPGKEEDSAGGNRN